jgi:HD-like signal output (HDOD) protein
MEIDELFKSLHALPSIPKVAQDLILQFDNPSTKLGAVASNIEKDPVIAAKILRLANSARFRGARESGSVEDAASRLGFETLRTLVLASAVTGAFKSGPNFDLKSLWLKSFEVAAISRLLAKQRGADAEIAFTSGLMHNIGRVANEHLQLGFGYPEVGAELAKRWNLPKLIQNAIAFQAKPLQAPEKEVLPLIVAEAIALSDALEAHGGPTDEAKAAVGGPLFEGVDLDKLFAALPPVLEADKAFAQLLD